MSAIQQMLLQNTTNRGSFTPTASTLAWYRMENNVLDSSWNSRNWTATSITYTTWKVWNAAVLNWSSSKVVLTNMQNAWEWTFSVWAKFNSTSLNKLILVDQWAWYIGLWFTNGSNTLSMVAFDTSSKSADYAFTDTTSFHYIVWTYKTWNKVKLYVDGSLVAQSSANFWTLWWTSNALVIWYNWVWFLNGIVDELIIENREWTSTEITAYYNMTV